MPEPSAPDPATYNGKTLDQLSPAERVALAGPYGPAIIGQKLYDAAQAVKKGNPNVTFGPALLDPHYGGKGPIGAGLLGPSDAETSVPLDQAWAPFSRSDLVKIAAQEGVSHKPKASRTDLLAALTAASVAPPDISEFEAYHGSREQE